MRITSKGQVTIPQPIREQCGLLPHTEVRFEVEEGRVLLVKQDHPGERGEEGGNACVRPGCAADSAPISFWPFAGVRRIDGVRGFEPDP